MLSEGTTNKSSYHTNKGDEFHPLFLCQILIDIKLFEIYKPKEFYQKL
jgi:hypothetical protein